MRPAKRAGPSNLVLRRSTRASGEENATARAPRSPRAAGTAALAVRPGRESWVRPHRYSSANGRAERRTRRGGLRRSRLSSYEIDDSRVLVLAVSRGTLGPARAGLHSERASSRQRAPSHRGGRVTAREDIDGTQGANRRSAKLSLVTGQGAYLLAEDEARMKP